MKKQPITNIRLDGDVGVGRAALCCEMGAFRYHVWLDSASGKPSPRTYLYKNSLQPSSRRTGHLDLEGATARRILPVMLAEMPKLWPAVEAQLAVKRRHWEAAESQAIANNRVRAAAPKLLAAALVMLQVLRARSTAEARAAAIHELDAAVKVATVGEAAPA